MKAIETTYAGRRFRSRLEARWAVTFDRFDWDWEYETQGFVTAKGPYLPDFAVQFRGQCVMVEALVEVKGSRDRLDLDLIQAVAIETRRLVLILGPHPKWTHSGYSHWAALPPQSGGGWQEFTLVMVGGKVMPWNWGPGRNLDFVQRENCQILGMENWLINTPATVKVGYMDGSGARFEHGENPRSQPQRHDPWASSFTRLARATPMPPRTPVEIERSQEMARLSAADVTGETP